MPPINSKAYSIDNSLQMRSSRSYFKCSFGEENEEHNNINNDNIHENYNVINDDTMIIIIITTMVIFTFESR